MRILFLKPGPIGDALLLTPTLAAVKRQYPRAKIWVVVSRGAEGILAGTPHIDKIFTITEAQHSERSWKSPLVELATRSILTTVIFDYMFELGDCLHSRSVAWMCRAKKRFSVRPQRPLPRFWRKFFNGISAHDWSLAHRVEKDFHAVAPFLGLDGPIPPLAFDRRFSKQWDGLAGIDNFALMHVGTRHSKKQWTIEGWVEVGRYLLQKHEHLLLTTSPAPEETAVARQIQRELGLRAFCTHGSTTWPEMAGLLCQTPIFITLDSAAMHLAAACQTPTVALFGPSIEEHWRPWQAPHRIVAPSPFEVEPTPENILRRKHERRMNDVQPAQVIEAIEDLQVHCSPPLLTGCVTAE